MLEACDIGACYLKNGQEFRNGFLQGDDDTMQRYAVG